MGKAMKRQDGYYWCRVDAIPDWQIFEWSEGMECFFGILSDERFPESYFKEIGERVERTPDKKQEEQQ